MVQVLASTKTAKIAAAALTAATLIGGAFSASAQQMASAQPDYSACNRMAQVGNHLGASQCRVDTLQAHTRQLQAQTRQLQAHTRQVQDHTQSEAALSQCISFLSAKKSEGASFDRPITRDNACAIARQLGMRNG